MVFRPRRESWGANAQPQSSARDLPALSPAEQKVGRSRRRRVGVADEDDFTGQGLRVWVLNSHGSALAGHTLRMYPLVTREHVSSTKTYAWGVTPREAACYATAGDGVASA